MTSTSSLTGSGRAYSSDMEESTFLKRNRVVHFARLGLSFLTFGVAIAVVACEAPPLQHYKRTSQWANAGLALWPLNFDIRPTIAALVCGCIVTVLNLVYIAAALLPSPYSRIKPLNIYASTSALAGFVTALVGILFIKYLPSSNYPAGFSKNETLHSWTCKWKTGTSTTKTPTHFDRDCLNTRAAFVLLCMLVGMEVLMGVIAAVGTWFQRDVSRCREAQFQLEKLEVATKHSRT
ncbi:hypothetical protein N7499_005603 [Penicillium canescens]|uniref:Uncharacterized protein n=1 Tax=Penicillium canescens TaxID=5083 RepID=A0AAD6IC09_PENCN|nr:uncharacterized protein N7446_001374 [Penicillium canescens]KAJ5998001.1 hypothetical protein N7522_009661 [Penicillium canescens]KAJ6043178.1 hypothetical protein N7460_004533 [Penicillium canescens]KAJ6054653.1 hypothetical protein N7444_003751 [Penicillium canescens]KAJ6073597.1 hypothetical protein N7446_001374 [Penicillium canescens]KAJ6080729.1 hypothetical protein N7499_005603 [Penicillium canescens]